MDRKRAQVIKENKVNGQPKEINRQSLNANKGGFVSQNRESIRSSKKSNGSSNLSQFSNDKVIYNKNLALPDGSTIKNYDDRQTPIIPEYSLRSRKKKNKNLENENQPVSDFKNNDEENLNDNNPDDQNNNENQNGEENINNEEEEYNEELNIEEEEKNEDNNVQEQVDNQGKKKPKKKKKFNQGYMRSSHKNEVNEIENLKDDENKKKRVYIFNNRKNNNLCSELLREAQENEKELLALPYAQEKEKKKKQFHTIGKANGISYQSISMFSGSGHYSQNIYNIIRDYPRPGISKKINKAEINLDDNENNNFAPNYEEEMMGNNENMDNYA